MLTALRLETDHLVDFQRDGVVCIRGAIDTHWVATLARGLAENEADPSPYGRRKMAEALQDGGFFDDYNNWRRIEAYREFVYHSPAAAMVTGLMGSRTAVFYHEHVLVKFPGAQRATPWHHDQTYYPVRGSHTCSLWIPLDPVPAESALRFVAGSHRWGRLFMPRTFRDAADYPLEDQGAPLESVPDIDAHPERYELRSWAMEPGDCLVFHMLTLHGAPGNPCQDRRRRAVATRWFGDDARFVARPWEISPEETGGLQPGQPMACTAFPRIWPAP